MLGLKTGLTRRTLVAMSAAGLLTAALPVQASDDIVIGGSIPLTGVFAFAGVGIEAGIQDYLKILNEAGGIDGRKVRLEFEDTGYKVDASVAAFNKITSQHDVHLYYGDSTGFAKTINPELNRMGTILMAGASFATELNNPDAFPNQFMAGPDYSEMIAILLEYIAQEKPGAKIVLVNSDTEFGRDPIPATREKAKALGLEIVEEIITPPTAVDVSTEVLKLRRARPDYTIFHGYILAPLPEFMTQAKQLGLETKFMGTFWSMDSSIWAQVGEAADGFMGVMPYRYYYDDAADAPMLAKIREMRPEYQPTPYIQGFLTAMLFTEAAKRTLEAGKELNGPNLKAALNSIENFDTGGIIGTPISIPGNSIPVGRIYRYDATAKQMVPASDWINLKE
ncbi:amino acid/amide ABC transporter substrate-binding protein (HAAT family) [Tepidamorphus gemmatus]|uniref:Amino acid/amide ABC transporter substrate-binding protein (HAAT family) n=1 Tax=Tepidamorphus gemmatus TaxID=747076 RepID=A0A4R3M650_9HYPH|nr:ABC transporter substrate-binding protein [Tepidamorphus gemmatus]TCT08780.1 amino acid/amide ABC transporter substrate-binding protein (HAAT family) [Tepidamorphus gemmatus]